MSDDKILRWQNKKDGVVQSDFCPTLRSSGGTGIRKRPVVQVKSATKCGYEEATEGDSINLSVPNSTTRRGRVAKSAAQTLDTQSNQAVIVTSRGRGENNEQQLEPRKDGATNSLTSVEKDNYLFNGSNIRRLTEIECERLQGFKDNHTQYGNYDGTVKEVSKTQRYKMCGNAVTVDVVELIANKIQL